MTIAEMHRAVNQGVDKIHSLQADVLLSEEIDHELNKNIMRFVNQRFNPMGNKYQQGFEQSQKRIDDLRTLLLEKNIVPQFKENLLDGKTYVDIAPLPIEDYLYLVKVGAKVVIDRCMPISFNIITGTNKYYARIPISSLRKPVNSIDTTFTQIMFVPDNNSLYAGNINIFPGINNTNNTPSTTLPEDLMEIIFEDTSDSDMVNTSLVTIFNENIGGLNFPNEVIVVVDPEITPLFNINNSVLRVDFGTVGSSVPGEYIFNNYNFKTLPASATRIPTSTTSTKQVHPCKFIQHDDIFKLLSDPFNTTKFTAPLYTIAGNNIELYSSDIFVIDEVKILYIKKPAKVSLSLQTSSDLPMHTHQEVVDMTVSTILGNIGDPRYQISAAEKLQSE